ncbi:hypothetical protein, conserved [Babesia ovata]|uniref:Extracellular matrix-binding ebh n=1 Tax=Babesia ovata TaxID=189622 RepID=A0A2H6KK39_9APIC|nr:uncharacterized protein BOVATA_048560 [Babesia ovata]GBE63363.1 hypothetical protein, conserved [Babesia ovata]
MAFLHGVLQTVKNDNVKTYDKNNVPNINNVLRDLHNNIGKGRQAFEKAVAKVEGKIKSVTTPITKLLEGGEEENFKNISKLIEDIQGMQSQDYESVVNKISPNEGLPTKTQEALKALGSVDKQLYNLLHPHVSLLHNGVETFQKNAVSDHEGLTSLTGDVKTFIEALEKDVNRVAKEQQDNCISELQQEFLEKIQGPINQVKINLEGVEEKLEVWITAVTQIVSEVKRRASVVHDALDPAKIKGGKKTELGQKIANIDGSKNAISAANNDLGQRVKELEKWIESAEKMRKAAEDKAKQVREKLHPERNDDPTDHPIGKGIGEIEEAQRSVARVNAQLQTKVGNLNTWMSTAGEVIDKANGKCDEILGKVQNGHEKNPNENNGKTEITKQAIELRDKANELRNAAVAVKKTIEGQVQAAQRALGELDKRVESDLLALKTQLTAAVRDYFAKFGTVNFKSGKPDTGGTVKEITGLKDTMLQVWIKGALTATGNGSLWVPGYTKSNAFSSLLHILDEFKKSIDVIPSTRVEQKSFFDSVSIDAQNKVEEKYKNLSSPPQKNTKLMNNYLSSSNGQPAVNLAIGNISSQGLKDLDKHIGTGATDKDRIEANTFEKPFQSIQNQLGQIITLVNESNGARDFMQDTQIDRRGVKTLLTDLQAGLGSNPKWKKTTTGAPLPGLQTTTTAISELQSTTLDDQPGAISGGIDKIRAELNKLRDGLLQMSGTAPKDKGVLDNLKDLGTNIGWNQKQGLESFKLDISTLNTKSLPTEIEAINLAVTKIKQELKRLQDVLKKEKGNNDDVINALADLLDKGIDVDKDENWKGTTSLQSIKDRITGLIGGPDKKKNTLAKIIHEAQTFYTSTIPNTVKNCVEKITSKLTTQVEEKIKILRNSALSNFAKSKEAELENLKRLVTEKNEAIRKLIDTDRRNGVKGLIEKLCGGALQNTDDNLLLRLKSAVTAGTIVTLRVTKTQHEATRLSDTSEAFNNYLTPIFKYVEEQAKTVLPPERPLMPPPKKGNAQSSQIAGLQSTIDSLLQFLKNSNRFDFRFQNNLDTVKDALSRLISPTFSGYQNAILLDTVKNGVTSLLGELDKVYMNTYDGALSVDWTHDIVNSERCAKVLFSILNIFNEELEMLIEECGSVWRDKKLCQKDGDNINPLGAFLHNSGYKVAKNGTSKEGELKLPINDFTGKKIHDHLKAPTSDGYTLLGTLETLVTHLNDFNKVGHVKHIPSPKTPCSIYEMLAWCCGLQFNSVYDKLVKYCDEYDTNDTDKTADTDFKKRLSDTVDYSLSDLCTYSRKILTTIAGHGDDYTAYSCEHSTNSLNLKYPASGEDCLRTLLDILRRMLPTLRYLRSQCKRGTEHHGWANCQYGRDISPVNQPCKAHPTDKSNGQPKCQANCQANSQPTCQPTSPLMSYLNDCLPGHLPHQLINVGCKSVCSNCPKGQPGTPCLTPLGFRRFSGSTRTGNVLCNLLNKFFSSANLSPLFCVAPKPPSTLPEHLSFALTLVNGWRNIATDPYEPRIRASIKNTSIQLYAEPTVLTNAIINAYGSGSAEHTDCTHPHLTHLTTIGFCNTKGNRIERAPYLQSLCRDVYHDLVKKHANLYLSWAIYLPWTFWDLLNNLYNTFCSIVCEDYGCRSCLRGGKCKRGQHGLVVSEEGKPDKPHCLCSSLVQCKGVSPTLYQYGLSFGAVSRLDNIASPKKCSDFCSQLRNVLDSEYFKELFKECDEFLWIIRTPFSYLLLSLWSLSLLYLLHIAVVRLDVLRIRSHLRSPSSHRIAAQSLLAAARVKALANDARGRALKDIDARRISLGQLAGQLSGFIGGGEEVKNALLNGLYSNVNELEKLLKTSCGGEGCDGHRSQIDGLNEKLDKLKNHLNEEPKASENLAVILSDCELNVHDGPLKELNKEIPKKIQELKIKIEELKQLDKDAEKAGEKPKNASQIDKLNKDLQSHNASMKSLETLNQLCEIANSLTKTQQNNENPKNLLDNLCTGLEKFLGYSNGNYTGEGIVYSDLDRLCDGVMSFLHGVLDNIQPKLGQHKTQIDSALSKLKDTNDNGITKYKAAIAAVAEGVRAYNERVAASNDAVKSVVTTLHNNVNTSFVESVKLILPQKDIDTASAKVVQAAEALIGKKVEECERYASAFKTSLDSQTNNIDNLNSSLSAKIRSVISSVEHEKARLHDVAAKEKAVLTATTEKVKTALETLKCSVNDKITVDVGKLVKEVKEALKPILKELKSISQSLSECIKRFGKWMEEAERILQNALDKVNEILAEANEGNSSKNPKKIYQAVEHIQTQTVALYGQLDGVKDKYNELFTTLKGKNGDGQGDEGGVMGKLKEADQQVKEPKELEEWKKDGGDWDVSKKIDPLYKEVNTQLGNAINKLWADLDKGLAEAYRGLGQFNSDLPGLEALKGTGLGAIRDVGIWITAGITDKQNIGNHLENVLKYLKTAENNWNKVKQDRVHQEIVEGIINDLGTRTMKGVEKQLGELLNAAAISGGDNLQKVVNKIVSQHLEPIKNEAQGYVDGANEAQNELMLKANEITQCLGNLCYNIRNAAELDPHSAKRKLEELRDTYFKEPGKDDANSIKKIYTEITDLQRRLEADPIHKLKIFLEQYADKMLDLHVKSLHKQVTNTVEDTKALLTTQAKKDYVTAMQLLIQQFAERVSRDLNGLPTQIAEDLTIGHKGFMAKLHEQFITKIEDIEKIKPALFASDSSPMSRAANILKPAYTALFEKLQSQSDFTTDFEKIESSKNALIELLGKLVESKYFDNKFRENLKALNDNVNKINPAEYGEGNSPFVLNALKEGFPALVKELQKAYRNVYEGADRIDRWTERLPADQPAQSTSDAVAVPKEKLTTDGEHGAKVCLTVFHILISTLEKLKQSNGRENINKSTKLGQFLAEIGYGVSDSATEQNGELDKSVSGGRIRALLAGKIAGAEGIKILTDWKQEEIKKHPKDGQTADKINVVDILAFLYSQVQQYYDVCHRRHIPNPVAPTNIYQMLKWLTGLTHHPVYSDLSLNGFEGLFEKPEKQASETKDGDMLLDEPAVSLDAYPNPISPTTLYNTLGEVCAYAEETLIALLGYGLSAGVYACDFNTNPDNLSYPGHAGKCLDLLVEIVMRLFHQLRFLYEQCTYPTDLGGWRNCWYGQGVGGSGWQCNEKQCANQECKLNADQRATQKANLTCNQHPKCGLKSPLQSFLEDGLQGFLPHHFSKNNCKITCDAPNHRGVPCKTPFGLVDLSTVASHTSSGSRLYRALKELCGTSAAPLTKLCSDLICVLGRPPQTLGDLFSFYHSFITTWGDKGRKHKKDAFDESVQKAHFGVPYSKLDAYSIFKGSHSAKTAGHTDGDLLSLVCSTQSPGKCGLYLTSLSSDISATFSAKHGDKYLSWIVYKTETFYDLLKKLFDECNGSCGGDRPRCRIAKCPESCKVAKQPSTSSHKDPCNSLVNCNSTLPTLCKYGFTINSPSKLCGKDDQALKRTCNDLCTILEKVVKVGNALHTLAFVTIPEYLFLIRAPFIWTLVALWSLSLLYLLHIAVVRLDVLRIRSHLKSLSSHRVAAQSLLAAARVKALANVKYFSP